MASQKPGNTKLDEIEKRMEERRKKELELIERKEAAARMLLDREKQKSEQDKQELASLRAQIQALQSENNELKQTNSNLQSRLASMGSSNASQPSSPVIRREEVSNQLIHKVDNFLFQIILCS